jgi:hypothetical protein
MTIQTDITTRTLLNSLLIDVSDLVETTNRIAVQVAILAREHGVRLPPELAKAAARARKAAAPARKAAAPLIKAGEPARKALAKLQGAARKR